MNRLRLQYMLIPATLSLLGAAYTNLTYASYAEAFVDPYFEIDPSYAAASEFSIALSPGVLNPAPETPGWFLFTVGGVLIAGLGLRERVRRTQFRPA